MFFDDYFNELFNVNFKFNREVKDQSPVATHRTDYGALFIVHTLGISKEDLKIAIKNVNGKPWPVLSVIGRTEVKKGDYVGNNSVNIEVVLKRLKMEDIKKLTYEIKDGITYIHLSFDNDLNIKDNTIEGTYIEDDENNW